MKLNLCLNSYKKTNHRSPTFVIDHKPNHEEFNHKIHIYTMCNAFSIAKH